MAGAMTAEMRAAAGRRRRAPAGLGEMIVCISDFQDGWPPAAHPGDPAALEAEWRAGRRGPAPQGAPGRPEVAGGYLERLPLACAAAGLVRGAEIWHHWRPDSPPEMPGGGSPGTAPGFRRETSHLARRAFRMDPGPAPFASADMLAFLRVFGPPAILCAWGLGVAEEILTECRASLRIYNSIDAPAIRVPPEVSRHFDLVLTGAEWQSEEIRARHPDMPVMVLPIGPDFAATDQFRPLGLPKDYDLIYVAAAQPYKRHDILFDAMEDLRDLRALCVMGYGELGDALREEALRRRLPIDFLGPPGVSFEEVNRLMNRARIGLVCGEADGAPAILTEYMLAGLPVLANAGLACGRQYILPQTGRLAAPPRFADTVRTMLERERNFSPRQAVLNLWSWPRSVARLEAELARLHRTKSRARTRELADRRA